MIGMLAPDGRPRESKGAQFDSAIKKIRRLPPEAFPDLPTAVMTVLRVRKCTVPQPASDGPTRNLIRGEFFSKDQTAWAVMCSANGFSSILVFRTSSVTHREELARMEDKVYLQDIGKGKIVYSREIQAIDREFIVTHYRAYGGPAPPPIDHQGIDDAFLEKASVTHYWHDG